MRRPPVALLAGADSSMKLYLQISGLWWLRSHELAADVRACQLGVGENLHVAGAVDLSGGLAAAEEELDALHRLQVVAGDHRQVGRALVGGPLDRDDGTRHQLLGEGNDLPLTACQRVGCCHRRETGLCDLDGRDVVTRRGRVVEGDVAPGRAAVAADGDDHLDPGRTDDLVRAGVVGPASDTGTAHRCGVAVLAGDLVGVDRVHRLLVTPAGCDVEVADDGAVPHDRVLHGAVGRVVAHLSGDNCLAVTVRAAHGGEGGATDLLLEREAGRRPLLERAADDPLH